jgi:hypothetical protein
VYIEQTLKEPIMKRVLLAAGLFAISMSAAASVRHSPNKLRHAYSPVTGLQYGENNPVSGNSDGAPVIATIMLDTKGAITEIKLSKDGKQLSVPASSYTELPGAQRAWLEERGALDTLVVEGENDGKAWRLALLFQTKQLWRRRLSVEGQRGDSMVFYSRDQHMKPSKAEARMTSSRGFHGD